MKDTIFLILIGLGVYGLSVGGYGLYLNNLQSNPITKFEALEDGPVGNHYVSIDDGYFYPSFVYEYERSIVRSLGGTVTSAIVPYLTEDQIRNAELGYAVEGTVFVKFPLSTSASKLDEFEESLNYGESVSIVGYTNNTKSDRREELSTSISGLWDWLFEASDVQRLEPGDRSTFNELENFSVGNHSIVIDYDEDIPPLSDNLFWFFIGLFSSVVFFAWWGKTNFTGPGEASSK